MELTGYQHILIFGGSFDPPHRGHIQLPQHVKKIIHADAILYIPAGNAPHKQHLKQTPAKHRLAMIRLATASIADAFVSDIEIRWPSDEPTYTVKTLQKLREAIPPQTKLTFLIGADMMRIFYQWHQSQKILEMVDIAVMLRPPDTAQALLENLPSHADKKKWAARLIPAPQIDISSTHIRTLLVHAKDTSKMLQPNVQAYISQHKLYQTS